MALDCPFRTDYGAVARRGFEHLVIWPLFTVAEATSDRGSFGHFVLSARGAKAVDAPAQKVAWSEPRPRAGVAPTCTQGLRPSSTQGLPLNVSQRSGDPAW